MSTLDGYVLTPDQFENARKRVAGLQARAMARGFTGQVSLSGQRGVVAPPRRPGPGGRVVGAAGVVDRQVLVQLAQRRASQDLRGRWLAVGMHRDHATQRVERDHMCPGIGHRPPRHPGARPRNRHRVMRLSVPAQYLSQLRQRPRHRQ